MNSPPINASARRLTGRRELTNLPQRYSVAPTVQARWQLEAERLLGEYQRTRRARHWRAYCRHIEGMAFRLEGDETA